MPAPVTAAPSASREFRTHFWQRGADRLLIPPYLWLRGVRYVCHAVPCDRLASIISRGGLYSLRERQRMGISEPQYGANWGHGKQEALAEFVACSFPTSWWMSRQRQAHLAIILLDARAVCSSRGVRFCRGSSASELISVDEILGKTGFLGLRSCLPRRRQRGRGKEAELFVPERISVRRFRGIYVYDRDSVRSWQPMVDQAARQSRERVPKRAIQLTAGYTDIFNFPTDYKPNMRFREGDPVVVERPVDRLRRSHRR